MAEGKEPSTPKSRIESLSDLIFGLALSIGALTLIGQAPSDFAQLLLSLLYYAFSFFILIRLWYSYTQMMSYLRIETPRSINLNMVLLFLVSIEPFLFNQLIHSNWILVQNVSIIYALDLGGLFMIQALLTQSVLAEQKQTPIIAPPLQTTEKLRDTGFNDLFCFSTAHLLDLDDTNRRSHSREVPPLDSPATSAFVQTFI